jgi:hypothetical protein
MAGRLYGTVIAFLRAGEDAGDDALAGLSEDQAAMLQEYVESEKKNNPKLTLAQARKELHL